MLLPGFREFRQGGGELRIPALRGVLVFHRRGRSRVPEACHQVRQRRARGGGEHRPGVPQVMESQVWASSRLARRVEHPRQGGGSHVRVGMGGGEQQPGTSNPVPQKMLTHGGE